MKYMTQSNNEIYIFNRIDIIQKRWNEIYNNNKNNMSFFQSYYWNESLFLKKKRNNICFVIYKSIIAPLEINNNKKTISILGTNDSSDYLSFIMDEDYFSFSKLIDYLKMKYAKFSFLFDKINEKTNMYHFLLKYCKDNSLDFKTEEKKCVEILPKSSFDEWFNSLKKGNRQNYRTAKNRLTKNGLSYYCSFDFFKKKPKNYQSLLNLYLKRRIEASSKYKAKRFLTKTKIFVKKIFLGKRFDTLTMFSTKESVAIFCIYINNNLAAFYEGFFDLDLKKLVIIRAAMNKNFSFYSPGQILLVDLMKNIYENYGPDVTVDLTRGIERYKFDFGGTIHNNWLITF